MSPENRFGLRHFLTEGERALGAFESTMTDAARPLAIYGFVWNDPDTLRQLLVWLGKLDVWIAISRLESICTPRFVAGEHPLDIEALHHPNIVAEKRVLNTVQFQTHPHVLLTGPNRGGKSTFCKSVGLAILTAQTWGFAWAKRMSYTPYTVMVTALRPTDTLGRLSLFESEIEFARDVLEQCSGNSAGGRVFVMMDEIFHSTNAHDGFEATRIFLRKLYDAGGHVTSMISTHYRGLTDVFQADVQPWAMEAHDDAEGNIRYTYRVIPGVSEKSSVMEILKERGLL
jgi:DNA mismatch repair ATPase MutS